MLSYFFIMIFMFSFISLTISNKYGSIYLSEYMLLSRSVLEIVGSAASFMGDFFPKVAEIANCVLVLHCVVHSEEVSWEPSYEQSSRSVSVSLLPKTLGCQRS